MRGRYKKISSRNVYRGKHMQVFCDEVIYPDGKAGTYEFYKKNDIVVVVPIYKDQYILIEQYRYLAGKRLIEFPMGLIQDGEKIESAGIRELEEETGFKTMDIRYLGKCMLNKGSSSQVCHFVMANIRSAGKPKYESSESDIDIFYMNSEKIKAMIKSGKIIDGPTIIGFTRSSI